MKKRNKNSLFNNFIVLLTYLKDAGDFVIENPGKTALFCAIFGFGTYSCQNKEVVEDMEKPPIVYPTFKTNEVTIPEDIHIGALLDSAQNGWKENGVNLFFEDGAVIVIDQELSADEYAYLFDENDGMYYNPLDVGIEEITKSTEEINYGTAPITFDVTVASTAQFSPLVNNPEVGEITGEVEVSYELSAAEEALFVANGVSISNEGTNMLFNNPEVPVTDAVIAYYGDYFTEDKSPYVLSTPEEQTPMGDVTQNEFRTNTTPVEGEKYFNNGNYHTPYDHDDDLMDRVQALQAIRQDTTYFDNTWTSDSTSYRATDGTYITNLVLQRDGKSNNSNTKHFNDWQREQSVKSN